MGSLNNVRIAKNRFFLIFLIALLLTETIVQPAFGQTADPETDFNGHWARKQISAWVSEGLMRGYADGTFRPGANITRAEFITLVNSVFGYGEKSRTQYNDVAPGDWYSEEIARAAAVGYITGYPGGRMGPNNNVSRQEAAAIIGRILELPEEQPGTVGTGRYRDDSSIPLWSKDSIYAITDNGYMTGYPDGSFRPDQPLTRGETVAFLDRVAGTRFCTPGTFGPLEGQQVIRGNVTVIAPGVTLQNTVIEGNLYLTEGIGDGEVTLKNIVVKGTTLLRGGGANSVTMQDCVLPLLKVKKEGVRIVASGNTSVNIVRLKSGATLVETTISGPGFETVSVTREVPANAPVQLSGEFDLVNVAASGVKLVVTGGTVSLLSIASDSAAAIRLTGNAQVAALTIAGEDHSVGDALARNGVLTVTDENGIDSSLTVIVDGGGSSSSGHTSPSPPAVEGVSNYVYYNTDVTPVFSNANAALSLNGAPGIPFASGTAITAEGSYVLVVTGSPGYTTTVNFVIDKTAPLIEGVVDSTYYSTDVTPDVVEGNIQTVVMAKDGLETAYSLGDILSSEGTYVLTVTDKAGNSASASFTIDRSAPVISGVTDNSYYNIAVTPTVTEANPDTVTLTLDGSEMAYNLGDSLNSDGVYVLTVTDLSGSSTSVIFTIDRTAPVIGGVADNTCYGTDITPTVTEANPETVILSKDGSAAAYSVGDTLSSEGRYVLTVTDKAGNSASVTFSIDRTAPVISGVADNSYYSAAVTPTVTEANPDTISLTLDGSETAYNLGDTLNSDGVYVLTVTDLSGSSTSVTFTIDQTAPVIGGVTDSASYNADVTPTVAETNTDTVTLTLDGSAAVYSAGDTLSAEGIYVLTVTDLAGNTAGVTFTIDKTAPGQPVVTGVTPARNVPTWSWASGGGGNGTYRYKLDDVNLDSGTTLTESAGYTPENPLSEGMHTLYVQERDDAGNWSGSGQFTINVDDTAPGTGAGISFSSVSATSVTANWGAASDNETAQSDLEYKLVQASDSLAIDTVAEADAVTGADLAMDWTADTTGTAVVGLNDSTTYYFAVLVRDAAGNMALYTPAGQATLDATPPAAGSGITFADVTDTTMTMNWGAATDNTTSQASLEYKLVKANDSTAIDTVAEADAVTGAGLVLDWTANTVTGAISSLTDGMTYYFAVLVRDAAGNRTLYTPAGQMTTDVTAPAAGSGITFSGVTSAGMTVAWGAATDNTTTQASLQYKLVKAADGLAIDTLAEADAITGADLIMDWTAGIAGQAVTGLAEGATYYFAVLVRDAAGNMSLYSPAGQATLDVTPPAAGSGITFADVTENSMTVNWGVATDNITSQASLEYKMVKGNDSTAIDTVAEADAVTGADLVLDWTANTLTGAVSGLTDGVTHYFAVLVRDAAGNMALYTPAGQVTPDVTSPAAGSGITFADVTDSSMTVNWGAATDNTTSQASLEYKLVKANDSTAIDTVAEADAVTGAGLVLDWTANTVTGAISSLTDGMTYYFAVLVRDAAGNRTLYTPAGQMTTDVTAPAAGSGITFSGVTSTGMTVAWGAATDNTTAQASLQYKLVKAADGLAIDTLAEADAVTGADLIMDWTTNGLSCSVTGLSGETTYYFAVVVKDAAGNKTLYAVQSQATTAASGDGSPANPFMINTIEDLAKVGTGTDGWTMDKNYILMANLDFNSASSYASGVVNTGYTTGTGWTPIAMAWDDGLGNPLPAFTGVFDGNGHTISNLYFNYGNSGSFYDVYGLFGNVGDGIGAPVIKNLGLENVNVTGDAYVGGLIGYLSGGTVENCYVTGTGVSGTGNVVGGLIGCAYGSAVTNCSASVNVSGVGSVGGLIGSADTTPVYYSYATGTVNNTSTETGGLIGATSAVEINYCYASGNVTGSTFTGGLLGNSQTGASIRNSYALGNVSADHYGVGGLVGNMFGNAVQNTYASGSVTANDPDQYANNVGGLIGAAQSSSTVSDSIGFGSSVACSYYSGGSATVNRVIGNLNSSTASNNYANASMTVTFAGGATTITNDAGGVDGADLAGLTAVGSAPLSGWEFDSDANGDKAYWKLEAGANRPVLYVDPDNDGMFTRLGTDSGL